MKIVVFCHNLPVVKNGITHCRVCSLIRPGMERLSVVSCFLTFIWKPSRDIIQSISVSRLANITRTILYGSVSTQFLSKLDGKSFHAISRKHKSSRWYLGENEFFYSTFGRYYNSWSYYYSRKVLQLKDWEHNYRVSNFRSFFSFFPQAQKLLNFCSVVVFKSGNAARRFLFLVENEAKISWDGRFGAKKSRATFFD